MMSHLELCNDNIDGFFLGSDLIGQKSDVIGLIVGRAYFCNQGDSILNGRMTLTPLWELAGRA